MPEITFDYEWEEPLGARGKELRATWARLNIRVGQETVTRVLDERLKTVRESIHVPLYPLAEWIATNWWPLLREYQRAEQSASAFASRHCIAAARDGFALPHLELRPSGGTIAASWSVRRLTWTPIEFISKGRASVPREQVEHALCGLVEAVVGRLEEFNIHSTLLQEEWACVRGVDSDEREFCELAGALGVDPFDLPESLSAELLDIASVMPSSIREEFFSSTDSDSLRREATAILTALESLQSREILAPLRSLREKFNMSCFSGDWPWEVGYLAAQNLRHELGIPVVPLPSFASLGEKLGVPSLSLEDLEQVDGLNTIDGVVGIDKEERPGFAIRRSRFEETQRFLFCRQLHAYLTSSRPEPQLVTRAVTAQQQENRAFAAELLVPSEALKQLTGSTVGAERLDEIAADYGVSPRVVQHQLENHGIARVAEV